jgi:hypothetical protein
VNSALGQNSIVRGLSVPPPVCTMPPKEAKAKVQEENKKAKVQDENHKYGEAELRARFLELDIREIHVEEKVNALETMKLLLKAGSLNEQRLHETIQSMLEQNETELMIVKEEAIARESHISDKLIQAEIEIQRLRSEVRIFKAGVERQERVEQSTINLLDRVSMREDTIRLENDRIHEEKQRAMKHMTLEYTKQLQELKKEKQLYESLSAGQPQQPRRTGAGVTTGHGSPGNGSRGTDGGADAEDIMDRLLKTKSQLEAALLRAKVAEDTVLEQAKLTRKMRLDMTQQVPPAASEAGREQYLTYY